jgi:hypothetical protein
MRTSLYLLLFLFSTLNLSAQKPLEYRISFPNAVHHEAAIELLIPDVPAGALTFRMSRSSPGRYATHEFGKNVYAVKAFNENGDYDGESEPGFAVWRFEPGQPIRKKKIVQIEILPMVEERLEIRTKKSKPKEVLK